MSKTKRKSRKKLDINQILLKKRQLFLFDKIDELSSKYLIQKLIALDSLNNKPITLFVNSPGGSVSDGFSIIDTMKRIKSQVITVIIGRACSMGAIVAIAGSERQMNEHSTLLFHEMAGGIWGDYTSKVLDRAGFLKKQQKKLTDFIEKHTKFTKRELQKAEKGELWLYPEEALKKGVIDKIIK